MHSLTLLSLSFGLIFAAGNTDSREATQLGRKIENFSLLTSTGTRFALHDLKDKKAVVVVFLSFECPVSNSYAALLSAMPRTYETREVAFLAICPTHEDAAVVERQARAFKIGFPVFRDDSLAAANAFKAEVTPEAFVLDGRFLLRYRGRIDDAYAARLKKNAQLSRHDLRTALDEVLAGKVVSEPITTAVGCPISRPRPQTATGKVTFHRDVLPILQKRCQSCHRPDQIGPFSLMTCAQASNWAAEIKEYTQSRRMPPWKPSEGKELLGERKMTEKEIATLAAWVDGGAPEGDPREAPPAVKFVDGWQLGKPDLVLTPEKEFVLGATGSDVFRCFVLPTGLTEDKYVVAYEVRPGNPRVVHHTLHFLDSYGIARRLLQREEERVKDKDEADRGPGYSSRMGPGFLPRGDVGGWAPGLLPHFLPEGVGYYLPKGSDFVLQVHYHRNGKVERDRTAVGLYFAKKPVERVVQHIGVPALFVSIPADVADHAVQGSLWVAQDCVAHSIMPHMHLLGKKIKVTMTPPDGPTTTLLAIADWDYNWQEMYFFKEPIRVKADTRFTVEAVYDNSAKNPNNPSSPPRRVYVGELTTNEMCFGFLGVTTEQPGWIGLKLSANGFVLRRPGVGPGPGRLKAAR